MVLCQYIQLKKKKKRKSKSTNFHVNIDHKLSIRDILQRFFPRNLETDWFHFSCRNWVLKMKQKRNGRKQISITID